LFGQPPSCDRVRLLVSGFAEETIGVVQYGNGPAEPGAMPSDTDREEDDRRW
jgi:hypothetical protein